MNLGDIRVNRRIRGVSIIELSKRTGINRDRLSLIERGLVNPSFGSVVRIAEGLGMVIRLEEKI